MASPHMSLPSPSYRGINTSLYMPLSDDTIQQIERAIWLKTIGQTDAARLIFDNELQTSASLPIVIIERADLELEAGRWGQAWRVLDSQVNILRAKDPSLELAEHRLVMLTRAMLGVRHRGDLVSAVEEIERTQQWLRNTPVSDYTDVQTSCVRRYVIVYMLTKLSSKYENAAAEHVPENNSISDPESLSIAWSGLHDLRRSLTARGMFHEANSLFRVELNRTPPNEREPIIKEFLSSLQGFPRERGRDLIEFSVKLQWSNSYFHLGHQQRARQLTVESEAAFNAWREEFKVGEIYLTPSFQALISEKLNTAQDVSLSDRIAKLGLIEQALNLFVQIGSGKTGSCLSMAADTALSLFQSTGDNEYSKKYYELHARLEKFNETVSEDLCDLIRHRCSLIGFTIRSMSDRQKSLEWIDGFLKSHPEFGAPGELEILHSEKATLLRGLQRLSDAAKAQKLADKFNNAGPTMGRALHISVMNAIAPAAIGSKAAEDDSEDEEDEFFFSSWRGVVGDHEKTANAAVDRLLDWSFEDVMSGHITAQSFEKMTHVSHNDFVPSAKSDSSEHVMQLKKEKRDDMWSLMFPPDDKSESIDEVRRNHVFGWLKLAPKGQRNKRVFCELMLRDSRQYHFSTLHLWNRRIVELLYLIDFYNRLPNPIRAVCTSHKNSWLSELALTFFARLEGVLDYSKPIVHSVLDEAEKYCELAVEEHRKFYQPSQIALQQRLGADICIYRIRLLEHELNRRSIGLDDSLQGLGLDEGATSDESAKQSTASDLLEKIQSVRSKGLAKIKETEEIYTGNELQVLWFEGLHTSEQKRKLADLDILEQRQRIAAFEGSFRTIQTAISLLLIKPILDKDIAEAWGWVQRYKARSLARTVGMRSTLQPRLLEDILASEKARPSFEKMMDLQNQINNADSTARFALRRELDAHRKQMRQDPTLQRLLDLREGVPLDVTEIATIAAGNGKDVVLIDWFYLQPQYPHVVGRMLLFTARSDSSVTMDELDVTIEEVRAWGNKYLDPRMLILDRTKIEFNESLGGLVTPIANRTKENEVLVFCPSDALFSLPLHALDVDISKPNSNSPIYEPLCLRNPIVYIHSHSLLRTCHSTTEHARHSPRSINATFISGISDFDAQRDHKAGRECIAYLASLFQETPMIDSTASKSDFMNAVDKSRLLHLHTHCNWAAHDPLDHHVEFPRRTPSEPLKPPAADRKLTAKELFEVDLLPGTHINLIACQGAVTDVMPGDEVRGLVPALLYSGAASTVSTLWNIDDEDGAAFSDLFFEFFLDQCRTSTQISDAGASGASLVDMAVACQKAVSAMDPCQRSLYHWAGFIMHGFWRYPVSDLDIKQFRSGFLEGASQEHSANQR